MNEEEEGVPQSLADGFREFMYNVQVGWVTTDLDPHKARMDEIMVPQPWDEIEKYEIPKDRWRIKNILPKEGFTILASVAGEGKSWLALHMAQCISDDKPFLDKEEFATTGCSVLYLDCENSKSELKRRGAQLGFKKDTQHGLFFLNDMGLNLNSDDGERWLREAIDYFECKVVFVDTLRAVAGGLKEDKAEDVRAFFNRYRDLKDEGVSVVFLDHVRKPSFFEKVPQKEHLLGSQDKTASVEVLLMLRAMGKGQVEVYQRKNRIAPEIEPFKILIEDSLGDHLETQTRIKFDGFLESRETQKEEAKKHVLEMLKTGGRSSDEIIDVLKRERKIGSRNIRDALRDLVAEKEIDVSKAGRKNYYFLPNDEKDAEGQVLPDEDW
jgi:hypothetical protein